MNANSRMQEIAIRLGVLEAQLEGLFRQCFQSCQQRQFSYYMDQYDPMLKEIGRITSEMKDLLHEHEFETKKFQNETQALDAKQQEMTQ